MISKKTRINNFKFVKEYQGHYEYLCKVSYTLGDDRIIHHLNFKLHVSSSIASFFFETSPLMTGFVTLPLFPGHVFTIHDMDYVQRYNNYVRVEAVRMIQRKHRIPFNSRVLYWLVAAFRPEWSNEIANIAMNGYHKYE